MSTSRSRMSHGRLEIFLSFFLITAPMVCLSCALIAIVYNQSLLYNGAASPALALPINQNESGVYYLNTSQKLLLTVSTWSSSLAPYLVGSAVTLASFPLARQMLRDQHQNRPEDLPTPYQLGLTLEILGGRGLPAVTKWCRYITGWGPERARQTNALSRAIGIFVVATFISLLIVISDTWLHLTTTPVLYTQTTILKPPPLYSYGLTPNCLQNNNSRSAQENAGNASCNLQVSSTGDHFVQAANVLQVLNNVSSTTMVSTYNGNGTIVYLAPPPNDDLARSDYSASTYGIQTQCRPISQECHLKNASDTSTPFQCPQFPSVSGDLSAGANPSWQPHWFADDNGQNASTTAGVANPFSFILAAAMDLPGSPPPDSASPDPQIIRRNPAGGIAFLLFCSISVLDVQYDSLNGSIARLTTANSNTSLANAIQATLTGGSNTATTALQRAAALAATLNPSSSHLLATTFAHSLAQTGLALGASAFTPVTAFAAHTRATSLATRVPAAPIWALIVCELLLALLGVVLAGAAWRSATGETREVQARLGAVGLVADRFMGDRAKLGVGRVEGMFDAGTYGYGDGGYGDGGKEGVTVGIDRSASGGYEYKIWRVRG